MPKFVDSISKIVTTYFAATCAESFSYKGQIFNPKPLTISPGLFRGYTCPSGCGGCCPKFSLDWIPGEDRPFVKSITMRKVEINGKVKSVFTDMQTDNDNHHCKNLQQDGRCGIHEVNPFSCSFELIRFALFESRDNRVTTRLFGRGWNLLRVDGQRGALCAITEPTKERTQDIVKQFSKLKKWADYFEIKTKTDAVIAWVSAGPHSESVTI